jgi:hypothetical protein
MSIAYARTVRLVAAALALAFSSPAIADLRVPIQSVGFENATPEALGPIEVLLVDHSSESCWTNLREVREYAEEKLVAEGFELAPQGSRTFKLEVVVTAFRQEALFGREGAPASFT